MKGELLALGGSRIVVVSRLATVLLPLIELAFSLPPLIFAASDLADVLGGGGELPVQALKYFGLEQELTDLLIFLSYRRAKG